MKTRNDPSTKPYFKCFYCIRFRKSCGGIPTRGMDLEEWCEYIRDVKNLVHLTNAYIAMEADVSLTTIERITAINIDHDIMRSTARRIELVVIGEVGEHDCSVSSEGDTASERIRKLMEEVEYWKKENDRKNKIIDKYLD